MNFWGYAAIIVAGIACCAWVVVMFKDDHFRQVSNEIWGHYWMFPAQRLWPYALIYAVYRLIENGMLAATLRAAFR